MLKIARTSQEDCKFALPELMETEVCSPSKKTHVLLENAIQLFSKSGAVGGGDCGPGVSGFFLKGVGSWGAGGCI